jgi:hypothetical protein
MALTKKDLDGFGLSLEEFFEYVIESKDIGADNQARFLYSLMSEAQQDEFFEYVDKAYYYEVDNDEFVSEFINFKNYFTL